MPTRRLALATRLTAALLLILLVALPAGAQEPRLPPQLDTYIRQAMVDWDVPGLAIAVVKYDDVVWSEGFGLREIGRSEPVDAHTVFAIGSTTKAFTSALVGMLVDEGTVSWDDPITEHLPNFRLYDPWVTREVTIRDLLSHRTGLPTADGLWYLFDYDRDELVRRVRYLEPLTGFRSSFTYQNTMYVVVGQLLAAATGKSWDELVAERIFGPLGMTETSTSVTDLSSAENIATPHLRIDGKIRTLPWRNADDIGPAGGINSSVTDMAQWLRLQLAQGTYDGQRLISPAAVQEMHTPQTVVGLGADPILDLVYANSPMFDYALGWFAYDYHGHKVIEHNGSIDGMFCIVSLMPEEKLGLVVLTNVNNTQLPHALRSRIYDSLLGLPERDWSSDILEALTSLQEQIAALASDSELEPVEGTSPSLPLTACAGTYANELYGEIQVSEDSGELVATLGPSPAREKLEHWHFDIFMMTFASPLMPDLPVTFVIDVTGRVSKLEMPELGTFERVPGTAELLPSEANAGSDR